MMVIIDDDDRDDDDDEQGYDEDSYVYVFHIRFKSPVRPDWRCRGCVVIHYHDDCRGCVVIIIMMTIGDAEDAR